MKIENQSHFIERSRAFNLPSALAYNLFVHNNITYIFLISDKESIYVYDLNSELLMERNFSLNLKVKFANCDHHLLCAFLTENKMIFLYQFSFISASVSSVIYKENFKIEASSFLEGQQVILNI